MMQQQEDCDKTFIPIPTEQTPLPFSIISAEDTNPSKKELVAMFKYERHRDAILDILNGSDPLYWDVTAWEREGKDEAVIVGDDGKPLQYDFDGNLKEPDGNQSE